MTRRAVGILNGNSRHNRFYPGLDRTAQEERRAAEKAEELDLMRRCRELETNESFEFWYDESGEVPAFGLHAERIGLLQNRIERLTDAKQRPALESIPQRGERLWKEMCNPDGSFPADVQAHAIAPRDCPDCEQPTLGNPGGGAMCDHHQRIYDSHADNATLESRLAELNAEMAENPPVGRALAIIDEMAEITNALQRDGARIDDIGDAKLQARFGVGL